MKFVVILCTVFGMLLLSECQSSKRLDLDFSDEMTYPGDIPKLTIQAKEGYVLYKKHCGMCHGITRKGKDAIPDFSKEDLDTYEAEFTYKKTKHDEVKGLVSEDLKKNIGFLRLP